MSLLKKILKQKEPEPVFSQERAIPKKDIRSVQTFTNSKSFKGFRKAKLNEYGLDGIDLNHDYFYKTSKFDFTNSAVQLMVVKANNNEGKCIRVVVDGRFMGNVYRSKDADLFDNIVNKKVDKVHFHVEYAEDKGKLLASAGALLVHWPNMGPRVTIE